MVGCIHVEMGEAKKMMIAWLTQELSGERFVASSYLAFSDRSVNFSPLQHEDRIGMR